MIMGGSGGVPCPAPGPRRQAAGDTGDGPVVTFANWPGRDPARAKHINPGISGQIRYTAAVQIMGPRPLTVGRPAPGACVFAAFLGRHQGVISARLPVPARPAVPAVPE
jgi:hypothetical protein